MAIPFACYYHSHLCDPAMSKRATASTQHSDDYVSPTSQVEESDAALSAAQELEPGPGLNGVPVRCKSRARSISHFQNNDKAPGVDDRSHLQGTMYVAQQAARFLGRNMLIAITP